jgi:hypothetical protein
MLVVGKQIKHKFGASFATEPKGKAFHIFSVDFVVDTNHKVWMVDVNDDPPLSITRNFIDKNI